MSYRSLKRVLGETSLERKCRFLFGASLLLLITLSFWWYGKRTEQIVHEQDPNRARILVDLIMVKRHHVDLEPNADYKAIAQKVNQHLSEQDYKWVTLRFDQPEGSDKAPKDQFERDVMQRFLAAPRNPTASAEGAAEPVLGVDYMQRDIPAEKVYAYYRPIYAEVQPCATCHHALGWKDANGAPLNIGDLMGVMRVTIPNGLTQRAINENWAFLATTAIITVFLAMVASYAIVRYVIVKPLRHLRDVSDAISHGNTALRAEIHTGDEFEALAVAFNRMLRHLVTIQEELRQVNVNLDGKVDELAQVNMRLYEMNTIKSDFLATMSHELRTPLNSILGFSEVLGSIDSLNDKQKRYVQNIQKSGRKLLEMINDILDLAKIESGKMEIQLVDFGVEHVISAQCDMARPLTEKKNIDLETRLESGLSPLHQDQSRLQQVLNNLLSNAIKFTPEGGRITVAATRDGDTLVLQVSDTGVGIAEDDQQVIFEKFRQGRTGIPSGDAMTREYSGSGLGLSIVKELCKLLGGEVSVQSELGKGSTFTVRVPWVLEAQPRLDSLLAEGFHDFTRPRFDFSRGEEHPAAPL